LDLLVLGGGLSGSRLVIELLDAILADPRGQADRVRTIAMLDRRGAFGGGVPYGIGTTQPGFLLIESVAESTPIEFQEWLRRRPDSLSNAVANDDEALAAWAHANEGQIASGRFEELFVPRRWFGRFVTEALHAKVKLAAARGIAGTVMLEEEAIDIEPTTPIKVRLAEGRLMFARTVVLATGCIPRKNDFGLGPEDGYVHDPYEDAFQTLKRAVFDRAAQRGPIEVAVVGSSASASVVVYAFAQAADLLRSVRSLRLISVSGYLAGGAVQAPGPGAPGVLAGNRPSARDYVDAAARLVRLGILSATRARVTGIRRHLARLAIDALGDDGPRVIPADVVVNCAGVGRIGQTDSVLLQNLAARSSAFRPNACRRGFELRPGTFEIDGADGCFVIGPLLNQDPLESQIESIHAVYRVAKALAKEIHARWREETPA
jgi:uncharacterized NAD(P)/FAD-binding protein YdhS